MIVYIYSLSNQKKVASPFVESYKLFIENPTYFYPLWDKEDHIATEVDYGEDVIVTYSEIKEMSREEKILIKNQMSLLQEGEYISKNKIISVERPTDLLKPLWKSPNWIEGATLEEVQEFKRVELKNARDTEILSHYLYTNNHIYDADLDSRNKLFQAQQLGVGAETNINWITADNQISNVSNADLNNIVNGIAYREQLAFNKFASKYTEVLNCTNIYDVKNIKY